MADAWIRLSRTCQNACRFCAEAAALDGVPVSPGEVEELLRASRRGGATRAIFAGGEPTLAACLPEALAAARALGLRTALSTNGRALAQPGRLEHLLANGLDEVRISLHGARPETHDGLVGVQGAWKQTTRAIRGAVALLGPHVRVRTVITQINCEELGILAELLGRLGVREWEVRRLGSFPADGGRYRTMRLDEHRLQAALEDAMRESARFGLPLLRHGFRDEATARFGLPPPWPVLPRPFRIGIVHRAGIQDALALRDLASALARRTCEILVSEVAPDAEPQWGALPRPLDLLVLSGLPLLRSLATARRAGHIQEPERLIATDFHLLDGAEDLARENALEDLRPSEGGWWPAGAWFLQSCFPGYQELYERWGIPLDRVHWRPYAIGTTSLRPGPDPKDCAHVLTGGNHVRDLGTLSRALAALDAHGVRRPIHLLGEASSSIRVPPFVRVLRGESFERFYERLRRSRYVVIPLVDDPIRAAGISMFSLALAAGRPLICTSTPSSRDHLRDGENALLVPPGDAEALADAMIRLETDDALLARLSAGALASAESAAGEAWADEITGPFAPTSTE